LDSSAGQSHRSRERAPQRLGRPDRWARPFDAIEAHGYAASWMVVGRIVEEIGSERMRAVLGAAWDDVIAYQGDAGIDLLSGKDDWRRFLDLLEKVGGSTDALSLFDSWVASPDDRALHEDIVVVTFDGSMQSYEVFELAQYGKTELPFDRVFSERGSPW